MGKTLHHGRYGPEYTPIMASAITSCTAAISRLDARICVSSISSAWTTRAAWSGYARALQLQGVEIDEIDVFSWGCGLQIPGRPIRATNTDSFEQFENWRATLRSNDPFVWRDALPTAISDAAVATEHPSLVRALDRVRQHARLDATITPWTGLPFELRDQRLTAAPLPCLTGGAKALRLKHQPAGSDWLTAVRALERAAVDGLARLDHLERLYRDAQRAIAGEYRVGALPSLAALSCHRPLLSPQSVANTLGMSVAGASKLLARAVSTGLLIETTTRQTWRIFLAADLAIDFGYAKPKRGRPVSAAPPPPASRELSAVFDAFDEEMAAIDSLLAGSGAA
ncbi:hypothetical protein EBBID32_16210 [Sphingobium indicum BiD32]|uniref:Uncharacterized protein n=1 Tax=Sphingobium indicum BiD32 TaxID=1301087 RepID=N1MNV1_9SPHN|nr:hypothetical protein [Sphingobium indicum]CCW17282.1 hypothetical protein EBBID32_16210 [Sphingobium indicum BiD32]